MTDNLLTLRSGLAKAKTGLDHCRIFFIGDSTTLGYGSIGGSGNVKEMSMSYQFAKFLENDGYNVTTQSFWGDGSGSGICETSQYDTRVSVGSGWSKGGGPSSYASLGGYVFFANSATSNLSFTPCVCVDTFIIYYIQDSFGGTFSANINGRGSTNINSNGSSALGKYTITGSLGKNTLNLSWISGDIGIIGFEAYNSAQKWVFINNAGWCGAYAAQLADSTYAWGPLNALTSIGPQGVIIDTGINDWGAGTNLTAFSSSVQAMITAWGSVILETPNPTSPASIPVANQTPYVSALTSLASSNNIPLVDFYNSLGSWTTANNLGLNYDVYHNNEAGYFYQAMLTYEALT